MHGILHPSDVAHPSRRTVVLHGLGGMGKTQLAIEYAKVRRADYSAIFWLNIKNEDSVTQSYRWMAKRISDEYPFAPHVSALKDDSQPEEVVTAVKRWLDIRENKKWLMVFESYDNPKGPGNSNPSAVDIKHFLPDAYHGSVIVTTTLATVHVDGAHRIQVSKLEDVRESLQILAKFSRRPDAMNGRTLYIMTGIVLTTLFRS
jgi:hypothetical protein